MEPQRPLPHIQVPATCPYSKPDQSSPCPRIPLPEDPASCYPPIYVWVFQVVRSFRFPHQDPIRVTCTAHPIFLDSIARISGKYILLCSFLHFPVTSSLLGPNILLSKLFSNILSLRSFLNVRDHVSHPYKTTGNIIVLCIFIFTFLNSRLEDKRFCTQW